MKQKFTQNDLVKYIYRETSATENLAIREALNSDNDLFGSYEQLLQGYQQFPKATFSPSPAAIQNILKYSEATAVESQH